MLIRIKTWMQGGDRGLRGPWRIFWVALAVRLLYLTLAHTYRVRISDDHFQFGWEVGRIARAVATGFGFADPFTGHTGPTAWVGPVYPLLLAGVFKLFGVYTPVSAGMILALNSLFSAATALAVYEIAARCFLNRPTHASRLQPRSLALWSAWLWALHPAAAQYAVHWIWDMCLVTFCFTWILVLALRVRGLGEPASPSDPAGSRLQWATFGLLWSLLALSNSTLLLFLPVCAVWMLLPALRSRTARLPALRNATFAGVVFLVCMAPWIGRNWQVFHAFIPTRDNLGAELYQSELSIHQGFPWGTTVPQFDRDPEFLHYKALGELAYVREKASLAAALLQSERPQIAAWTLKRVYFFWVSVPHPVEKGLFLEAIREINFCFLSLGGLLGLALALRREVPAAGLFAWAFLLLPLPYYAVTVQARFRHPLEPLICILTVFLFQSTAPRATALSRSNAPAPPASTIQRAQR